MISLEDDDDDQVEITNNNKKKLSNLFDDDNNIISNIEDSKSKLFYRPKSNKKLDETNKSSSSKTTNQSKLNVFIASAVNVYKYDKESYAYIGKYGMALLGNDTETIYRIILYTAKNQPICSVTVTETFNLIIQPKNYCLFKDDQHQNWLVLFSNDIELGDFCRHLSHCIFSIKFADIEDTNNTHAYVLQPLCHQKPPEDSLKKMDSQDIICYKLIQVMIFEQNKSLHSEDKNKLILCEEMEHKCSIKNNLDLVKKLFSNLIVPGDRNYLVISIISLDYFKTLIPNSIIENIEFHKSNQKICKIAFDIQLVGFEKQKQNENLAKSINNKNDIGTKIQDLAEKMSRIGAMPILPMISNNKKPNDNDDVDNSDNKKPTETKISKEITLDSNSDSPSQLNIYDETSPSNNHFVKNLESKLDQIQNSLNDLKIEMEKSVNKTNFLDSNLTLDSAILLNSIQKMIDENHKLKSELNEKKLELTQINQKLLQMIQAQTSSQSSSGNSLNDSINSNQNYDQLLKLKEEIVDLKDRINTLKEENYRLQREKDQLIDQKNISKPSPKLRKYQLKQIFNDIHFRFTEAIDNISTISNDDKQNLNNILASVLKTVSSNNNNVNNPQDNQSHQFECDTTRSEKEENENCDDL